MRAVLPEKTPHPLKGPSASDTGNKAVNIAAHLFPQFTGGPFIMDPGIVRVFKLLGDKNPGIFRRHLPNPLYRPHNAVFLGSKHQLRPQGFNQLFALFAHVFRHHDLHHIPLEPPYQRDPDSRVAGSRFHDNGTRFQPAIPLGPLYHGQGYPVLYTSARIQKFRFGKDPFSLQLNERGIADQI